MKLRMNLFFQYFLMDCNNIRDMYKEKMITISCHYLEIVEVVENGASSFVVR